MCHVVEVRRLVEVSVKPDAFLSDDAVGPQTAARISPPRLKGFLSELATIGRATSGGFYREALTQPDHDARARFLEWAKQRGLRSHCDPFGNLFVRLPGSDENLAPVMTGSHLDTQPNGGAYDGVLGVVAGLEAICAIQDASIRPNRPIEVAVWMNEEGSRFTPGCMGSRAFVDPSLAQEFRRARDDRGISVGEELDALPAALPPGVGTRPLGAPVHRFVELHIEQGPLLEEAGAILGIVEGIQGFRRYAVDVVGEPAHSGTTPRSARKDALLASVKLIDRLSNAFDDEDDALRFTVGKLLVEPNSLFVVPGAVKFWVDIRHPDAATLSASDACLRAICAGHGTACDVAVEAISFMDPIHFRRDIVASIEALALRQRVRSKRIFSGAGHDAQMLHTVCPTGMIFIPCKHGISHSPKEDIDLRHAEIGAQLLTDILIEWAET